jgi:hypothetical protein
MCAWTLGRVRVRTPREQRRSRTASGDSVADSLGFAGSRLHPRRRQLLCRIDPAVDQMQSGRAIARYWVRSASTPHEENEGPELKQLAEQAGLLP